MGNLIRKCWIQTSQSKPYSPWQVRAELCNRELNKAVRTVAKTPSYLQDFCSVYHAEIQSFKAHPLFKLHDRTPYKVVTGYTPDISEYTVYKWYETFWYYDQQAAFSEDKRKLA